MKRIVAAFGACLALAGSCHGGEVVRTLPWTEAPPGTTLAGPAQGGAGATIRIERRTGATIPLLRIDDPPLSTATWAIVGQVRYEGVIDAGYLELWSVFADGRFFSRTLDQTGPMSRLAGDSDWRTFVLPFFSRPDLPPPVALEVSLVLPAAGTVEIGPLQLVQYAAGENPLAASGAWWSDSQGGWIGGVAGATLGVLGSLVGWLGSKGKAPTFVLGASRLVVALGIVTLAAGVVAIASAQPYAVWYPLVLIGALSCGVMAPAYRRFSTRYRDAELRRLQAFDAR